MMTPTTDTVTDLRDPQRDRKFVTALARGLDVLRAFQPGDRFLGNQEIAERTGLPKPTVTRLTYTLTQLGYLAYSERLERYQLSVGILALGYATLASFGIRQVARRFMQELADRLDASVALGARDRLTMVYLENCRGGGSVTLRLDVGSQLPIATSAMGRAFLAALPETERDYLLEHIRRRNKADWPRLRAGIERSLAEYAECGYVKSVGEWERDVNGVGVPLVRSGNGEIYAFNCGGPSFLLSEQRLEQEAGPRLKQLVHNVGAAIDGI